MKAKLSTIASIIGLVLAASAPAYAQVKLTLKASGSADKQVDLDPASTITVDAAGNVTATYLPPAVGVCLGTACAGSGGGGGAGAPTVSLTPSTASITAGQSVNLQWQAGNGADICVATTSGFSNWDGILSRNDGSYQRSVTFPTETGSPFTMGLACYNENGISTTATSVVTVAAASGGGGGGGGDCDITTTDANFQPSNLARVTSSFNQEFGAAFPNVGSTPLYGFGSTANTYKALAFVPTAGMTYRLSWYTAQYTANNTDPEPGTAALITVSPCPGDFRSTSSTPDPQGDTTLISACRQVGAEKTLTFGAGGCVLEPGRTYYLNLTMKSSFNQIQSSNHTCGALAFCEVNATLN